MGQAHVEYWLHHVHNTWSAFSHFTCSVRKGLGVFLPEGVIFSMIMYHNEG